MQHDFEAFSITVERRGQREFYNGLTGSFTWACRYAATLRGKGLDPRIVKVRDGRKR